jgi:NADH-quinone oxidoreductase subunit E
MATEQMVSTTELLARYKPEKENLLLILHDIQNNCPEQYISAEDITEIAKYLNITYSAVYGVVTYYSMFSLKPRGRYIIRVCNSPVCELDNSENILEQLKKLLGIEIGDTTSDGLFTLETTECLGQCADSPGMLVNERFFGNIDSVNLNKILEQFKYGTDEI